MDQMEVSSVTAILESYECLEVYLTQSAADIIQLPFNNNPNRADPRNTNPVPISDTAQMGGTGVVLKVDYQPSGHLPYWLSELVRKSVIANWDRITAHTPICLDLFLETIEFCVNSSFFCFNQTYYKQKTGLAMGSPIASPIAEIVVDDLLDSAATQSSIPLPHIRKYVDDLFLILPEDSVEYVQSVFNSQHRNIQFTVEVEKDRSLPFLDMMLHRNEEGKITTDWYMKPIASGRFLNFYSFHPLHQKLNVATAFAKRVSLFSSRANNNEIHEIIRTNLRLKDYPIGLINGIINRLNEKSDIQTAMVAEENKISRSLTNIDGLSANITKTLRSEYADIRTASKQAKTIGCLFPIIKDKTPRDEQTNVTYRINCKGHRKDEETQETENCEACYIGCTTRKLKQRISQHRTQTNELKRLWNIGYTKQDYAIQQLRQQTALLEHEIAMDHLFDIDKADIIDRFPDDDPIWIETLER
ncbi:uncharacterized protein LOC129737605 [Uranotaenia lowii]|uniref:uncharacterized protein LOC129737605 n=1 Tax=Uranotaenia lowii TaxID=190385 RepID=UPI00247A891A|nr:uncharacterized protein LOC129737605 [Uranotaenia lowii]